jgi:hypothetical protein
MSAGEMSLDLLGRGCKAKRQVAVIDTHKRAKTVP